MHEAQAGIDAAGLARREIDAAVAPVRKPAHTRLDPAAVAGIETQTHASASNGGNGWERRSMISSAWRGRSEEHTSELQSLMRISYAVFCLKKKNTQTQTLTKNSNRTE